MSITDHPTDPPFGAKRHPPMRVVETPLPPTDPIQGDIEAQLREIATAQGFKLVPVAGTSTGEREPANDREWVAASIDKLRHLDLGAVIDEMFPEAMPKDRAEAMQKAAEWAAKTNPRNVQGAA